jgi:hypothetical protein
MKALLLVTLSVVLITGAHAKDFYIRVNPSSNLVLSTSSCGMEQITGDGWQHSEVHFSVQATGNKVMTLDAGCWKRFGDKVYVLDEVAPFWIAPDGTGGDMYYQLDVQPCSFKVPGISFAGWRKGRAIAVFELQKNETIGKASTTDYGPMCWRYNDNWLEKITEPQIYSAFNVMESPLP